MSKALFYMAVLIGLLIIVAFYVGSTSVGVTAGQAINSLALTLQGRTASGAFAGYPAAA